MRATQTEHVIYVYATMLACCMMGNHVNINQGLGFPLWTRPDPTHRTLCSDGRKRAAQAASRPSCGRDR